MTSESEDQSAPVGPRRRPRQFSLRALLVLVAVLAIGLGWWTHRARGQRQAVEVEQFPRLKHLNFTGTPIGDDGCRHFAGLGELRAVHLGRTKVTDAGLRHFARLGELEWTFLGHTQITDAGLEHLAGLANLRELNVVGTHVTAAGFSTLLQSNTQLRVVDASGRSHGPNR
jgi:Leucine Rich repeat